MALAPARLAKADLHCPPALESIAKEESCHCPIGLAGGEMSDLTCCIGFDPQSIEDWIMTQRRQPDDCVLTGQLDGAESLYSWAATVDNVFIIVGRGCLFDSAAFCIAVGQLIRNRNQVGYRIGIEKLSLLSFVNLTEVPAHDFKGFNLSEHVVRDVPVADRTGKRAVTDWQERKQISWRRMEGIPQSRQRK